ncbi:hypothetical protein EXIGLDRAFT_720583 [Exidia glandulosa HHB12029]|uniref:Cyclin N-terminal domain-containing protein n=1 Tax=Exidia glandulosa HHB12029 TaxID=1314781 RepID=A0A165GBE9_EXIGL|nr:hypothetical protein EXIGLDRAFT_720583 [Exidia glandulosa HHB12029]
MAGQDALFYGNGPESAAVCARFITSRFGSVQRGAPPDFVHSLRDSAILIAHLFHRVNPSAGMFNVLMFGALLYLQRLKSTSSPNMSTTSGYGLFLTAYMISFKWFCDRERDDLRFKSTAWADFANHRYSAREINAMEREMCTVLGWRLHITLHEFISFQDAVYAESMSSVLIAPRGLPARTLEARPLVMPTEALALRSATLCTPRQGSSKVTPDGDTTISWNDKKDVSADVESQNSFVPASMDNRRGELAVQSPTCTPTDHTPLCIGLDTPVCAVRSVLASPRLTVVASLRPRAGSMVSSRAIQSDQRCLRRWLTR